VSKPIVQLATAAENIAIMRDLTSPLTVSGTSEVTKLATSFNTMLTALGTSMAQQRQLVQDASRELRTPLTSLRANSELLERSAISEETHPLGDNSRSVISGASYVHCNDPLVPDPLLTITARSGRLEATMTRDLGIEITLEEIHPCN